MIRRKRAIKVLIALIILAGATTDYAVLGEVKNNETDKVKNIYWNYHCESASVKWIDDTIVKINDIELDVTKDIYDYRHQ